MTPNTHEFLLEVTEAFVKKTDSLLQEKDKDLRAMGFDRAGLQEGLARARLAATELREVVVPE